MSAAVIAALQARHIALDGVATAPTEYPSTMPDSNVPAFLVDELEGRTQWMAHAGDVAVEERTYLVRALVRRGGLGTVDEAKQQATALLRAVLADYRGDPALTATAEILIARPGAIQDTGIRPAGSLPGITWGDEVYTGFEVRLLVEERFE